jgi:hypothetical protein
MSEKIQPALSEVVWSALLAGKPGVVYGSLSWVVRWPTGMLETVREVTWPIEGAHRM